MSTERRPSRLPRRLSPAAIDRYRGCPRTAYLQFIAKAPAEHVVTPARLVGNGVHEALERFHALGQAERTEQALHRLLRAAWKRQPREQAFGSPVEESYYGREALDQPTSFFKHFDTSTRPFARERWMEAPLPNGSIVYGKVDRLDLLPCSPGLPAQSLDIVDYKSGRGGLEDGDLQTDSAAQTNLLATEWQTKAPVRRVRYLYLASASEARWEVEREDVEAARERLDALTRQMHTDDHFESRPGTHCGLCPFAAACTDREGARRPAQRMQSRLRAPAAGRRSGVAAVPAGAGGPGAVGGVRGGPGWAADAHRAARPTG